MQLFLAALEVVKVCSFALYLKCIADILLHSLGTISKKLIKDFSFNHVSTGDLLRKNIIDGTPLGALAKGIMDKGELLPDDIVLDMLMEHQRAMPTGGKLLLDGYPRTTGQAQSLEKHIKQDLVIALDIPHQTIIDRLSTRWIHPGSGRTYAYDYNPPVIRGIDDLTGENLIQRDDDKPEAIAARLKTYEVQTLPLLQYYKDKGILHTFSGTESDVIYPEIKDMLKSKYDV